MQKRICFVDEIQYLNKGVSGDRGKVICLHSSVYIFLHIYLITVLFRVFVETSELWVVDGLI